ncbi:centromere protein J [Athalia rosae]|uniref:centromere protein J n=1 Tax=Athalia rosae TaxID=37344 RepID=UPI0020332AB5|nr:centromere protein J [Athalia rosae]XP_012266319.2 centromere protein J [Athalia rosae]
MASEASIVERLQELRRWQVEQQERLLQQQQEQRETLSRQQVRMYQALGLTIQNASPDKNNTDSKFQDSLEDSISDVIEKKKQNRSDLAIVDIDRICHMSPQKRHELLHAFSHSSNKVQGTHSHEDQSQHGSPKHSHHLIVPEESSPAASGIAQSIMMCKNDNSSANTIDSNKLDTVATNSDHLRINDINGISHPSPRISPELLIDGVKPLPLDRPTHKSLIIDDIPVPSPKKDFHTLLEERLKESQSVSENYKEANGTKKPVKKPFLKKGQGLARFRSSNACENSTKKIRPRTMSLPTTVRMEHGKNSRISCNDRSNENSHAAKKAVTKMDKSQKKHLNIPSRAQSRLNLKNVQPPVRVRSKSMCNPREPLSATDDKFIQNDRFNVSDIESKTKRELEEVRIFELLEEKAENSSFCSTSSTVIALLQQSVQSTPLKVKAHNKNQVSSLAQTWTNERGDTNEDLLLAEIVYTTQSNSTGRNSSNTYKTQYQNQFQSLQECDDPEPNDDESHQFDNNDNMCELPYGTDVDSSYNMICSKTNEANLPTDKSLNNQENYDTNTSLHVRFAEYNEYKTISLTDTSTISTESEPPKTYSDQRAWSDYSATTDSSDDEEFHSMIASNQARSFKNQRSAETKLEVIRAKQLNEKHSEEASCDNLSKQDRIEGQPKDQYCNENQSDFEMEPEESHYNYEENTADDVFDSPLEPRDINETSVPHNEDSASADLTLVEEESDSGKTDEENGLIFKSELLKTRLLELEREIEIFRKENIAVATLKEKLQEERRSMERSLKEKESRLEERKLKLENDLQEERKRLVREKAALDNRLKDAQGKAQQSKQERQELQNLREQLEELKEEMNQKESRWNAAQARHRSQVRILQTENSKLKQDIQNLQNIRKTNTKMRLSTKKNAYSNTKAIHQINKKLDSQKGIPPKENTSSDDEFPTQPMMEAMQWNGRSTDHNNYDRINSDGSKVIVYNKGQMDLKNCHSPARMRDLYENLLKDATVGLKESGEAAKEAVQSMGSTNSSSRLNEQSENCLRKAQSIQDLVNTGSTGVEPNTDQISYDSQVVAGMSKNASLDSHYPPLESSRNYQQTNVFEDYEASNVKNDGKMDKQGIRELQHSDGRRELWYPNGNIKKISANGLTTKLIYYNGDVCENREDGSVKYFYATTRTWHTTMSDGLEILEFPDGQIERRSKDGTVEVSFPDGSVRILQSNGTEKWALPDGTFAETSAEGEKILTLPNGQREVHTKEHKRREYPDGTVKLVYPDGTQETRYASGRVRLKDGDGNLIMDSYHQ